MKGRTAGIVLLGMLFVFEGTGRFMGQELTRPAKGFAGCVQPEQVDKSESLGFKNTCTQNMQFTLSWSGKHPAQDTTYHLGGNGTRRVNKVDEHWSFLSEAPATFNNGQKGSVSVVERATNVQDLYQLLFHNNHASYTFADVTIKLYYLPPISNVSLLHRQIVLDPGGDQLCCFFDKTVFAKYEVSGVKAEDDP